MLKQTRKINLKRIIIILVLLCSINSAVYAQEVKKNYKVNAQNTIISLNINNQADYDFEVYVNSDGTFNLPFKQMAELLQISYKQDPSTRFITFTAPSGANGTIDVHSQRIVKGNEIIEFRQSSPVKMMLVEQGLKEETKDEIFIPISTLNDILETEISADQANYSVFVKSSKLIKALVSYDEEGNEPVDDTPTQVIKPESKGLMSLDTIKVNSQVRINSVKEEYKEREFSDSSVNNISQVELNGTVLGGDYKVSTDVYNNKDSIATSGLNIKYNKEFENSNLEAFNISGIKTNTYTIGSDLQGVQVNNFKDKEPGIRSISGEVTPENRINVYVNDKLIATLNTIGDYYTLKDLPGIREKVNKLKIEEVFPDGRVKTVKEKLYPSAPDLLPEGKTNISAIAGVAGYNNRFLGSSNTLNDSNSKKLAGGVKVSHGVTKKLTVGVAGVADNIISKPEVQEFQGNSQLDPYTNSLLFGTTRNVNSMQGQTALVSANYAPIESLNISSEVGVSNSKNGEAGNAVALSSEISANYAKTNNGLSGKLFNYSPEFYMAGSSGYNNSSDSRKGAELNGYTNFGTVALNGGVSRYSASMDGQNPQNSSFNFNEYNLNSRKTFKDNSSLNVTARNKSGKGKSGKLENKSYEADYNKKLTENLDLNITSRLNSFDSSYVSAGKVNSAYKSELKTVSGKLDYDLPKNAGKLSVIHDTVQAKSNDYSNNYNALRIGYAPPNFKNISTSVSAGYHYTGANKGFDLSASIGYQFPSGKKFEVSYSFNKLLGSFINNVFVPRTSRSSLAFSAFDAVSLIAGGIKSIGFTNSNYGFIEAITFLDTNQNGIKDKDEPDVPNVPVNLVGVAEDETNKKGSYTSKGIPDGIYSLRLDDDKLPSLLSLSPASKPEYVVKVDKKQKTKVFFGLVSSIGNVSGKVTIQDQFKRLVNLKDIIVSIFNDKGEEIKYTSVDENGKYLISGLAPGKYTVRVDKKFTENYHLKSKEPDKELNVNIPAVYDNFVDINNADLDYIQVYGG